LSFYKNIKKEKNYLKLIMVFQKIKLFLKGILFLVSAILIIFFPKTLINFLNQDIFFFKIFHIIWFLSVLFILKHIFAFSNKYIPSAKLFKHNYKKSGKKIPKKLKQKTDKRAILTAFFWIIIITIIGVLYYLQIFNEITIYSTVVFFIFMDQICISLWCPFNSLILKNKCCKTCRIHNWDKIMIFSPLFLIPGFWTYSLVFFCFIVLIQWEYFYLKHPERFFEITNENLMCKNCKEKNCKS
jgi:hypothetical protein